ncbi:DUF485 domain-containing protein [Pseudonocardia ailaonensis]
MDDAHGASGTTARGVEASPELESHAAALARARLRFAVPVCLLSFGGFLVITALAGFTSVLDAPVAGPLNWLFLLILLSFPAVGLCAWLYHRHAVRWDARTAEIIARTGESS